jgi:ribokinase
VGSVNADVIVSVPVLPTPGATVTGGILERHGGGKGANQAVAAARLGARVGLVAAVGDDPAGAEAVAELAGESVDVSAIARATETATGVAMIVVDASGENQIAVASGANQSLDAAMVVDALDRIDLATDGVCLLGFEVRDEAIEIAAEWASGRGRRVIVDPAPARRISAALIAQGPILKPNAGEAEQLSGEASPHAAAVALHRLTGSPVVVTMGEHGVVLADGRSVEAMPAFEASPVDTTGAGDTFSGALAVGLAESRPLVQAVRGAQAAAAISTRAVGARTGMPTRAELDAFLAATDDG